MVSADAVGEQTAEERILGGLDPEQRVVATTLRGPVLSLIHI